LESVFFRSICATVNPVRSIATGDIQLADVLITEFIAEGSLRPDIPIIIPIIIAINIGFTSALSL
jgi:hypothetical protein